MKRSLMSLDKSAPDKIIKTDEHGATAMNEVAVVTYRNGLVENIHHAHIAIVDARGKLLYSFGDAERVIWARSTAKPAQALAILEAGAF